MKIMHHQPPSIIKSSINWLNQSLFYFHNAFKKSTVYTNVKAMIQNANQLLSWLWSVGDKIMMTLLWCVRSFLFLCFASRLAKSWNEQEETRIKKKKIVRFQTDYCLVTMLLNERGRSKKIAVLRPKHLQLILYSFNKTFLKQIKQTNKQTVLTLNTYTLAVLVSKRNKNGIIKY